MYFQVNHFKRELDEGGDVDAGKYRRADWKEFNKFFNVIMSDDLFNKFIVYTTGTTVEKAKPCEQFKLGQSIELLNFISDVTGFDAEKITITEDGKKKEKKKQKAIQQFILKRGEYYRKANPELKGKVGGRIKEKYDEEPEAKRPKNGDYDDKDELKVD